MQVPQSLIPGRLHSHSPELQVPRCPAPQPSAHSKTPHHHPCCRLWLVTCTLGLRTGPPSLFTWTRRVGRQTARRICEDISRQDSMSSKTNPECGWRTSRGRNSKGMKWEWGWGQQEPGRSQHPFVSVYQHTSSSVIHTRCRDALPSARAT